MAKKKAAGITIPGTKIKAPPWALAAAGGGVLAVLFLMKDSDGGQPGSGDSLGFFAEEVAQRMDDERRIFAGALEDIGDQLAEMRDQKFEDEKLPDLTTNLRSERGDEVTYEEETIWFDPPSVDLPGSGINLNRVQQAESDRWTGLAEAYASGKIVGTMGGTAVAKAQISTKRQTGQSEKARQAETDRWTAQAAHYGAEIGAKTPVPKTPIPLVSTPAQRKTAATTASIQDRFNKLQAERLARASQQSGGLQEI